MSRALFPSGKWMAISIKNKDGIILFDKSRNYFVELKVDKELIVTAEDNILFGNFTETPSDSIKMGNIHLTDVCCNSDTAKALFDFFDVPVKYT